jgi:IS5 family transposase
LPKRKSSIVDASLIAAPSSPNNDSVELDPELQQTKKDNQ